MEIVLPDPCLVVLIGAAGAGKSTFAVRHFAPDVTLSSDRYRAIVSGDEANQSATRIVFRMLHRDLAKRLAAGRLTVVDATSVEPSARRGLLELARAAGAPAVAIVLDLPVEIILERNARRHRKVDEAVVHRHISRLRASLDGPRPRIDDEGFAAITVLRDPAEVDRVTIRRDPASVPIPPVSPG